MSDFYWQIETFDGTKVEIPPEAVGVVKRRWDNKEPIHTTNGSIPANQIKSFAPTAKPYGQQPLLEAAAQAFNEPIIGEDGGIKSRWVKKSIPQRVYAKDYAGIPAYKRLGDNGGMVTVAFKLAIHDIDMNKVDYCSEEEILTL